MSKNLPAAACALGMAIMTAQAAEPPKAIGDGEGRLDIIARRVTSSGDKRIKIMTG